MAATAAERQAKYRKKCRDSGENVRRTITLSTEAVLEIHRLAKHNGISQRHMLEKLIMEAGKQMMVNTDADHKYINNDI